MTRYLVRWLYKPLAIGIKSKSDKDHSSSTSSTNFVDSGVFKSENCALFATISGLEELEKMIGQNSSNNSYELVVRPLDAAVYKT